MRPRPPVIIILLKDESWLDRAHRCGHRRGNNLLPPQITEAKVRISLRFPPSTQCAPFRHPLKRIKPRVLGSVKHGNVTCDRCSFTLSFWTCLFGDLQVPNVSETRWDLRIRSKASNASTTSDAAKHRLAARSVAQGTVLRLRCAIADLDAISTAPRRTLISSKTNARHGFRS